MSQSRYVALIPARSGSKRLPHKNRKNLLGKPLIDWTVEAAKASGLFSNIIVSSDDDFIHHYYKDSEAVDLFNRPAELAADNSTANEVLYHTIKQGKLVGSSTVLILLQPTSPLRNEHHIREAITEYGKADTRAVVSVAKCAFPPEWCLSLNDAGCLVLPDQLNTSQRTQDMIEFYSPNGAVYIKSVEDFIADGSLYGANTRPYMMSKMDSLDIDTQEDFDMVECVLKSRGQFRRK